MFSRPAFLLTPMSGTNQHPELPYQSVAHSACRSLGSIRIDPSETFRHARALLNFIGKECPDFIGFYIPKTDLERTYQELCAAEAWKIRHWTAIARHLGCITKKREVKREGVRFVAYQIPRKMFR